MNSGVNRWTPSVHGYVIDSDVALGQQLLDVPVGQAVPQVPADRHGDHLPRKPSWADAAGTTRLRDAL